MEINFIYLILFCYIIGSIPFAYLIPALLNLGDIRKIGSGNVGATNVLRTGKKFIALLVLILDILKSFIPVTTLYYYFDVNIVSFNIILVSSFTIIGHIFPIWLKFKGGKGVATYIGLILAINYKLGILFILLWLFIAYFKKYSSLASIFCLTIIPITSVAFIYDIKISYILIVLSSLIIFKHLPNIKRLLSGNENKIKI